LRRGLIKTRAAGREREGVGGGGFGTGVDHTQGSQLKTRSFPMLFRRLMNMTSNRKRLVLLTLLTFATMC